MRSGRLALRGPQPSLLFTCSRKTAMRWLADRFGCRPADSRVAIGPCIGPCLYEVDEPVIARLQVWPWWGAVVTPNPRGRWQLDLRGAPGVSWASGGACRSSRSRRWTGVRLSIPSCFIRTAATGRVDGWRPLLGNARRQTGYIAARDRLSRSSPSACVLRS